MREFALAFYVVHRARETMVLSHLIINREFRKTEKKYLRDDRNRWITLICVVRIVRHKDSSACAVSVELRNWICSSGGHKNNFIYVHFAVFHGDLSNHQHFSGPNSTGYTPQSGTGSENRLHNKTSHTRKRTARPHRVIAYSLFAPKWKFENQSPAAPIDMTIVCENTQNEKIK